MKTRPNNSKGKTYPKHPALKPKDLCGIPWRLAFALQADGWWLRSDIIWAKPNPMPESVTDRPTKAHEYLFLLTKSANYFYDNLAIAERAEYAEEHLRKGTSWGNKKAFTNKANVEDYREIGNNNVVTQLPNGQSGRNKRSVWTVATAPYPEAHFATYPPDLIKPCMLAGTSAKGCCAKCGAPWERVVEKKGATTIEERGYDTHQLANERGMTNTSRSWNGGDVPVAESKTIGWQPTCKCKADIEPCVCLDPFAGSGTTGQVALELGRKAVLIELNPKYVELIKARCNVTMGLALA